MLPADNATEPQVATVSWPKKVDVFGVRLSCTNYSEVTDTIIDAARQNCSFVVDFICVDPLVQATINEDLRNAINSFEIACPDGHPVRLAMNHLQGTTLTDRVCGPDTTVLLLRRAAEQHVPVYFYGSTPEVLNALCTKLAEQFPGLRIAGSFSPPFRPLSVEEQDEIAETIRNSGARLVFIGLGAPRQSYFARDFRNRLQAGLICVGAAFDFLAQTKKRAPAWMQRTGLEWMYRLCQEPGRLGRRYVVGNFTFAMLYLKARLLAISGSQVAAGQTE